MHPRLIEIPFLHLTLWSFGAMAALGGLTALLLVRRMARRAGIDPARMVDGAMYSLLIGMVGARVFFVIHHCDQFREDWLGVFAIWHGGLEFLGGVVPVIAFLLLYTRRHKLPVRRYLDIMAVGLMMGLAFGRIGCFLNGCCYGRPTELPWAVRFPYRSYAYLSQMNPNPDRGRPEPYFELPQAEYLSFHTQDGRWFPKDLADLTESQRLEVTQGTYRCLPVHPTQLYASVNALLLCTILYAVWRRSLAPLDAGEARTRPWRPGMPFSLALVLYGIARFLLESVRDDNPFEAAGLTISQILAVALVPLGIVLFATILRMKPDAAAPPIAAGEHHAASLNNVSVRGGD